MARWATDGFEAGVRDNMAPHRRAPTPQSRRRPVDGFWAIDLDGLGGPIPRIREEPMELSPPRRRPVAPPPLPGPRAETQPRPRPQAVRHDPVAGPNCLAAYGLDKSFVGR